MENLPNTPPATFESVWAALQETRENIERTSANIEKFSTEFKQFLEESEQLRIQSNADYERRLKKMEKDMGSWATNHGFFAEEYFFNSFEDRKQNFFGEKFDEIIKNVKGMKKGFHDEYDILLIGLGA